jgi:hypothetical protein
MQCPRCGTELPPGALCQTCAKPITTPDDTPQTPEAGPLHAQITAARAAGDLERAVPLAQALVAGEPRSAAAHALLGELYQQQEQFHEAMEAYRQAVQLHPSNVTYRELFDQLIDRAFQHPAPTEATRLVPPPTGAAPAPADAAAPSPTATPAPPPTAARAPAPPPPTSYLPQEPIRPRLEITETQAKWAIGAALGIFLLSLLLTFQPWNRGPAPAQNVTPLTLSAPPPPAPPPPVAVEDTPPAPPPPLPPTATAPAAGSADIAAPTAPLAASADVAPPLVRPATPARIFTPISKGRTSR